MVCLRACTCRFCGFRLKKYRWLTKSAAPCAGSKWLAELQRELSHGHVATPFHPHTRAYDFVFLCCTVLSVLSRAGLCLARPQGVVMPMDVISTRVQVPFQFVLCRTLDTLKPRLLRMASPPALSRRRIVVGSLRPGFDTWALCRVCAVYAGRLYHCSAPNPDSCACALGGGWRQNILQGVGHGASALARTCSCPCSAPRVILPRAQGSCTKPQLTVQKRAFLVAGCVPRHGAQRSVVPSVRAQRQDSREVRIACTVIVLLEQRK